MTTKLTSLILGALLLLSCRSSNETTSRETAQSTEIAPIEEAAAYSAQESLEFRLATTIDNWDDGGPLMRYVFLNMGEFFPESVIDRAGPVAELIYSPRLEVGEFLTTSGLGELTLDDYAHQGAVDGLVVVQGGEIVYETYPRMRALDRHLSMSVSKAYAGTLIAILAERGLIELGAPVESYLPELAGSGWEAVSVRDVLDMASGIDCQEREEGAYSNPETCYYQYEASLGWLGSTEATYESPHDFVATLGSHRPAGEAFEYTSPNTFVLSWLAERVTEKSYAQVLSEEIWQKIGAEDDGRISSPRDGISIAHGGISARLRDMARFGLLFTPSSGIVATESIISPTYLAEIQSGGRPEIQDKGLHTNPERLRVDGEMPLHNSYQWDFVMEDGDFYKGGYGGSGLYISPSRDLVIAFFGTFEQGAPSNELKGISRQLAKADLFN